MRVHPDVIRVISREAVQLLLQDGAVDIEPTRVTAIEMEMSSLIREHFVSEECVR
jgi:hypothetical protein